MKFLHDNIQFILGTITVVVVALLLRDCSGNLLSDTTTTTTEISVDSVYVTKTVVDTITFHDTLVQYIYIRPSKPIRDTIYIGDTLRLVNTYKEEIEDSLISGVITSQVDGVLVSQNLVYSPKFPKFVIQRDSIFVNTTKTIKETTKIDKWGIYPGFGIGGNSENFILEPGLAFNTGKGSIITGGYDLVNKTYSLRYYIKLGRK